jgi:hypothetical protein|tara:strand:+ start:2835 stop:3047 length:213 start_codon:yes stop_codon:yes gene_type:complete
MNVQYQAFDELPKEVQDVLNYADIGFTLNDILYLHNLYVTGEADKDKLVQLLKQKEAWSLLTRGLNGIKL